MSTTMRNEWEELRFAGDEEDAPWNLFHENSKVSRYERIRSDKEVVAFMRLLHDSLPFDDYPEVALPKGIAHPEMRLSDAILQRCTARSIAPSPITLDQVTTLLHYAYGLMRDPGDSGAIRPFRAVPSGGGMYPLEIFFHHRNVGSLEAGLYHYNPARHSIRLLKPGDHTDTIRAGLIQQNLAADTSLQLFITAVFERSVFKYRDRGYRFILLEAGHVGQNIALTAAALGLGCVTIGGFVDRDIDAFLGLDGVTHSTVYMAGIGRDAVAENR